jgi:hypothetical protein
MTQCSTWTFTEEMVYLGSSEAILVIEHGITTAEAEGAKQNPFNSRSFERFINQSNDRHVLQRVLELLLKPSFVMTFSSA